MAFKPEETKKSGTSDNYVQRDIPTPRAGSRKARTSLMVDMGIQDREPFVDPKTKEEREQEPCHQVAVFIDLVADVVDYGGKIGKQQYRLPLNRTFKGEFTGINFTTGPQKDADGNILKEADGKTWKPKVMHPLNVLTKLAKTVGREDITIEGNKHSLDIEQLLDLPFMATVEVKKTPHKEGKEDSEGNPIIYTNVNFKGSSAVPEDDDGSPLPVPALNAKPLCITFKNAKKADIQFIRASLLKKIKLAHNYAGSKMEAAVQAYEAEKAEASGDEQEEAPAPAPAPKAAPKAKPKPVVQDDDGDTAPF